MIKTSEQQKREELVAAYREVQELGLMGQSTGNLSCRFEDGMLISCSGANAKTLTTERVVKVHKEGSYDGALKPSSEWRMHLAIYQRNEAANAVVHTHSDYCVALASHNLALPGFHYMVGSFGGRDVECVPYSTFGTQALADDAAKALDRRTACLLGNHGMISRGANFEIAVGHANQLEILCRHYCLARQLGEPQLLTQEQWADLFEQARKLAYSSFSEL
jgi:L-fuculose-phosphate aldolase